MMKRDATLDDARELRLGQSVRQKRVRTIRDPEDNLPLRISLL